MVGTKEWYQDKYESLKEEINEIRIKKLEVGSLEWVELFDELASRIAPRSINEEKESKRMITWTCHICKEERGDTYISVFTKPVKIGNVQATENIRYCNDKIECVKGAKTFTFFKDKDLHND